MDKNSFHIYWQQCGHGLGQVTWLLTDGLTLGQVTWLLTDGRVFSAGRLKLTAWGTQRRLCGTSGSDRRVSASTLRHLPAGTPPPSCPPWIYHPPQLLTGAEGAQTDGTGTLRGWSILDLNRLLSLPSASREHGQMSRCLDFRVFLLWWWTFNWLTRNHWSPKSSQ